MGLVKDELGIEVEESILQKVQDPKFQETDALLSYRDARRAKQKELSDEVERKKKESEEPKKLFGIF